jgi:hypothetical protein
MALSANRPKGGLGIERLAQLQSVVRVFDPQSPAFLHKNQ